MAAEFTEGDAAGVAEASSMVPEYEENAKDKLTSPALLLIIVGEPFNPQHKELVAERIATGLTAWDSLAAGCDLVEQLGNFTSEQLSSSVKQSGDAVIEVKSEYISIEVLINPHLKATADRIRSFASTSSHYKYLLHAGHVFQSSGSWILNDGLLEYTFFAELMRNCHGSAGVVDLGVTVEGRWSPANLAKLVPDSRIRVNPQTVGAPLEGLSTFVESILSHCRPKYSSDILDPSNDVGNITFSQPTLYIFPSGEGSSAFFNIRGFNLLVDGGYKRKSCFWDLVRHFERIDATLVTHLGERNVLGLSSFLARKLADDKLCHPALGPVFINCGGSKCTNYDAHTSEPSLTVSVADESAIIVDRLNKLNVHCHSCVAESPVRPVNLYHKVGYGSLDLFVLSPASDSKDLKEYVTGWSKNGKPSDVSASSLSVSAMLVFSPTASHAKPTRILFPGAVSQTKLFECLDRLKTVPIFKTEDGIEKTLHSTGKSAAASSVTTGPEKLVKAASAKTGAVVGEPSHSTKVEARSLQVSTAADTPPSSSGSRPEAKTARLQTAASDTHVKDAKKMPTAQQKKTTVVKDSKSAGNVSVAESKKSSVSVSHKDGKPAVLALPVKGKDKEVSGDVKNTATGSSLATKTELPTSTRHTTTQHHKKPDEMLKKIPIAKKGPGIPLANGKSHPEKLQVKPAANGAASSSVSKDSAVLTHSSSQFSRKVANGSSKTVETKKEDIDEDDNVVPELVAPEDVSPVEQQIVTELSTVEKIEERSSDVQSDHEQVVEASLDSIVHETIASVPTYSVEEVEERQMECLQNDVEDDNSATTASLAVELDDEPGELLTADGELGTVVPTTEEAGELLITAREEDAEHNTQEDNVADLTSDVKQADDVEELLTAVGENGENGADVQEGLTNVETHCEDEDHSVVPVSVFEQIEKDGLTSDNKYDTNQSLELKLSSAAELSTEDQQNEKELVDTSPASLSDPDNVANCEFTNKLENGFDTHDHMSYNASASDNLGQMTPAHVSVIEQNENREVLTGSGEYGDEITTVVEELPIATDHNDAQSKVGSRETSETPNENEYNPVAPVVELSENAAELAINVNKYDAEQSSAVQSSDTYGVEKCTDDNQHSAELQDQAPTPLIEPGDSEALQDQAPAPLIEPDESQELQDKTPTPLIEPDESQKLQDQAPIPLLEPGDSEALQKQAPAPLIDPDESQELQDQVPTPLIEPGHSQKLQDRAPTPLLEPGDSEALQDQAPAPLIEPDESQELQDQAPTPLIEPGHSQELQDRAPTPLLEPGDSEALQDQAPAPLIEPDESQELQDQAPTPLIEPGNSEALQDQAPASLIEPDESQELQDQAPTPLIEPGDSEALRDQASAPLIEPSHSQELQDRAPTPVLEPGESEALQDQAPAPLIESDESQELQDLAPTPLLETGDAVGCESAVEVENSSDSNNQMTISSDATDILEPLVSRDEQQENNEMQIVSGESIDQLAANEDESTINSSEGFNTEALVKHEQPDLLGNIPDSPDILDASIDIEDSKTEPNLPSAETIDTPYDVHSTVQPVSSTDETAILSPQTTTFDPASEWGEPQSLPAPTDNKKPSESKVVNNPSSPAAASEKETRDKSTDGTGAAKKSSEFKIPAPKAAAVPRKKASTSDKLNSTELVLPETGRRSSSSDNSKRGRLSLQPSEMKLMMASHAAAADHHKSTADSTVKTNISVKPSSAVKKSLPSKPIIPCFVDLAYLPTASGCSVDVDFFRRVRARHYVVSAVDPDPLLLSHLADAKRTWDSNMEVIVLPTEDADSLREWYQANYHAMAAQRIILGTPASRCSINLLGSIVTANRVEL